MAGGTVYPTGVANDICDRAHDAGIQVHLDGARVFNAATYLSEDVAEMTKKFDSVQFCLSKGLGAPVGSMIVGSREFIERCRPIRKMLGGGMRQVGVLAAAGLVALEHGPTRLQEDHDNAQVLAKRLAAIRGIALDPSKVQTNIIIFSVKPSGLSASEFLSQIAAQGVLAVPVDAHRVRMVTHLDVTLAANRNGGDGRRLRAGIYCTRRLRPSMLRVAIVAGCSLRWPAAEWPPHRPVSCPSFSAASPNALSSTTIASSASSARKRSSSRSFDSTSLLWGSRA